MNEITPADVRKWQNEMLAFTDTEGNVERFQYLMKSLGYAFKKGVWMEMQALGFRYYHSLQKMDEMFAEDKLRYYVDMPWMSKPHFYSSDI